MGTPPGFRDALFDATGRPYPGEGLPLALPDHIRQTLESQIVRGGLAPGKRLTEEELGQRLGVSRTPIREAMLMLEGQGLVVRRRGRGSFVADRTTEDQAEAIYQVRFALEGHLTARAAANMTSGDLDLVDSLHRQFQEAPPIATEADALRSIRLDSDLHWAIYNAADSDLTVLVRTYWGRLQRELYVRVYATRSTEQFVDQHARILDALRARNAAAAQAAMVVHLQTGWDVIRASYRLDAPATRGAGAEHVVAEAASADSR